jgi:hypothetical protein
MPQAQLLHDPDNQYWNPIEGRLNSIQELCKVLPSLSGSGRVGHCCTTDESSPIPIKLEDTPVEQKDGGHSAHSGPFPLVGMDVKILWNNMITISYYTYISGNYGKYNGGAEACMFIWWTWVFFTCSNDQGIKALAAKRSRTTVKTITSLGLRSYELNLVWIYQ